MAFMSLIFRSVPFEPFALGFENYRCAQGKLGISHVFNFSFSGLPLYRCRIMSAALLIAIAPAFLYRNTGAD